MSHRYAKRTLWLAGCLSVSLMAGSTIAHAQTLPDGKGKAEFQRVCSGCHAVTMATSQRMDQPGWAATVNDMVSRGAQGSQQDFDNITAYLAANFGKDAPAVSAAVPAPTPAPAVASPAPAAPALSPAAMAQGAALVKSNGCLQCHRLNNEGSYIAPDLTDVGSRRSAADMKAALVSPAKNVHPENRTVQLTTKEGKTVTGRILNQDGFSVQLIDTESRLRSFQKDGLRTFTIVTTNPMPAYSNKMSEQDLGDLVQYLSSLKASANP